MGSYNGDEDDAPTKTTVVLSHARGTDPSLATSVAPEEARVVGLWVARPAAPPVPTLRDVAAVEKLRETARDAILLVVTCEGASARYRCFVGGHAVRPCRVRVRTLTHDSRREYEACPDGVCGASWPALRSATAAPFDASTATAAFARDRGLLDELLADGARGSAPRRTRSSARAASCARRWPRRAPTRLPMPPRCASTTFATRRARRLEADDAALSAARAAAADDDAAAAEDAEVAEATVPPTPHNSLHPPRRRGRDGRRAHRDAGRPHRPRSGRVGTHRVAGRPQSASPRRAAALPSRRRRRRPPPFCRRQQRPFPPSASHEAASPPSPSSSATWTTRTTRRRRKSRSPPARDVREPERGP